MCVCVAKTQNDLSLNTDRQHVSNEPAAEPRDILTNIIRNSSYLRGCRLLKMSAMPGQCLAGVMVIVRQGLLAL